MRTLITGITGFAGNYLTRFLLDRGVEVFGVAVEDAFEPFLDLDLANVKYYRAEITDDREIRRVVAQSRPDSVFHLAALTSPSESLRDPQRVFNTNVQGTLNLLEAVRESKASCRVLFVSSSHVYGEPVSTECIPEEAPFMPTTPYAASKVAGEMLTFQYWHAYGIEAIRVRAFNHTGAGQREGFVCPDLARRVVEIERGLHPARLAVSDAKVWRDFSNVRDIVHGYYLALTKGVAGEVYNLCSGQRLTVETLAMKLASMAKVPISLEKGPSRRASGEQGGMVGDPSRALRYLGWKTSIGIDETLAEVLDYWRHTDATRGQTETP
jgi:GDP-4-dehydro-6-deoxy-D-mannose reductase